jgi:hypothetical protein
LVSEKLMEYIFSSVLWGSTVFCLSQITCYDGLCLHFGITRSCVQNMGVCSSARVHLCDGRNIQ